MSELVKRHTASEGFDQRQWRANIDGSLAHAEMLAAQGIIAAQDLADMRRARVNLAAAHTDTVMPATRTGRRPSR